MKNLKKFFAVLVVVTLMVSSIIMPAVAADDFSYADKAAKLNDLGLYKGISTVEFNPDLASTLNRETGLVMLLRVVGLEKTALDMPEADVTAALAKFKDAKTISSWAKNQVAYAVKNGLTVGTTDTTFAPKASLNGKQYCTFILRQLGYTVEAGAQFEAATTTLSEKGGLTAAEATKFADKTALIKDDLVGISYGALFAKDIDGKVLFETLIAKDVIKADAAAKAGLTTAVISSISATNGKIDVIFDKDIVATPSVTDFTVSQSVYAASETPTVTTVTAEVYGYTADTKTAELKVAPVTDAAAKSVYYTVTFKNGTPVTSAPVTFAEVTLSSAASLSSKVVEASLSAATTAAAAAGATYTVKDSAGATINVTKAELAAYDTKDKTVLLTLASDTKAGALYSLTVGSKTVNFGGKAPETTKPTIKTVESTGFKEVTITYSEPVVLNGTTVAIAEKYASKAALAVKSLKYNGKDKIVVETDEQKGSTLYGITVTGTADFSGNVMDKDDAKNFSGTAKDTSPIKVSGASALVNPEEVTVQFNVNINPETVATTAFKVEECYGSKAVLPVTAARIATTDDKELDGTTALTDTNKNQFVVLTVPGIKTSTLYKVTVSGLKSEADIGMSSTSSETVWNFNGYSKPTDPYTISIAGETATSNTLVEVSFQYKVVEEEAETISNYAIAEAYGSKAALAVKSAELQADGKTVKLTTAAMSNVLYKLTVTGIKDVYGNAIKTADNANIVTFSGKGVAPKVDAISSIGYISDSDTVIEVAFDQNVGSTATDVSHYSINNDVGYPEKAETVDGSTNANKVRLTLPKLTAGKVYTLTVKGLENADGIAMDSDGVTATFVGKGNGTTKPQLTGVMPIDNQTLKIYFDRDVKDSTVDGKVWDSKANKLIAGALKYKVGSADAIDLALGATEYAYQDSADKNVLIVRIATDDAFRTGTLKLIGSAVFDEDYDELQFAAKADDPAAIVIENVQSLDNLTLRVYFSMPVYGNDLSDFADVNTTKGYGSAEARTLSNASAIDDTNKVYDFKLSSEITTRGTYYLNVNPATKGANAIIMDAKEYGYVGIKDEDTSTDALDHVRQFAGSNAAPADIKDVYAVMTDNKTIKVVYPANMNEGRVTDKANYTLWSNTGATTPVQMAGAAGNENFASTHIGEIVYSKTDRTATITLNTAIVSGPVFVKFDQALKNAPETATVKDGDNTIVKQFAVNTTAAAKVKVESASFDNDTNVLTVTFNQKVIVSGLDDADILGMFTFNIPGLTVDDAAITAVEGLDGDDATVDPTADYAKKLKITLADGATAGTVGTVKAKGNLTGINGNGVDADASAASFAQ